MPNKLVEILNALLFSHKEFLIHFYKILLMALVEVFLIPLN